MTEQPSDESVIWEAFADHVADHTEREARDRWEAEDAARWAPVKAATANTLARHIWEGNRDRRWGPSWQLTPTPNWPAIAIPGQPGQYLTIDQEQSAA